MIRSFQDKETEKLWNSQKNRIPANLQQRALDKLELIHAAVTVDDLRIPPGNRLEALKGNRAGQHSIRINDQYRICFRWEDSDAFEVEITDYH